MLNNLHAKYLSRPHQAGFFFARLYRTFAPIPNTMITRNQIKHITSLQQAKYRNANKLFIAEGEKLAQELLDSHLIITTIYAVEEWITENHLLLQDHPAQIIQVGEAQLQRISTLKTANKVLLVVEQPHSPFNKEILNGQYTLMLDDIRDPGNMGTILRTADWFGIHQVICSPHCVDIYNPKVVQSTMGSITRVKVHTTPLLPLLSSVQHKLPILGTLLEGTPLNTNQRPNEGIIIMGSESHGISQEIRPLITHPVLIPPYPANTPNGQRPESLNASIACAIICFALRQ